MASPGLCVYEIAEKVFFFFFLKTFKWLYSLVPQKNKNLFVSHILVMNM